MIATLSFMFVTLFIYNIGCPPVKIINESSTWSEIDGRMLRSAIRRCPVKYPDSPCLKRFWKKEELTYWALCGRSR